MAAVTNTCHMPNSELWIKKATAAELGIQFVFDVIICPASLGFLKPACNQKFHNGARLCVTSPAIGVLLPRLRFP
jgi:hypothetical protein